MIHKSALVAIHKGDFKIFDAADVDGDENLDLDEWLAYLEERAGAKGDKWLMNLLSTFTKNMELGVLDPKSIHTAMVDECRIFWEKLNALSAKQAVEAGRSIPSGISLETLLAVIEDSACADAELFRSKLADPVTLEDWQRFLDQNYHNAPDMPGDARPGIQANLQLKQILLHLKNSPTVLNATLVKTPDMATAVKNLQAQQLELQQQLLRLPRGDPGRDLKKAEIDALDKKLRTNEQLYKTMLPPPKVNTQDEDWLDEEMTTLWIEVQQARKDNRTLQTAQHHLLSKLRVGMGGVWSHWRYTYTTIIKKREDKIRHLASKEAEARHSLLGIIGQHIWARSSGIIEGMDLAQPQIDDLLTQVQSDREKLQDVTVGLKAYLHTAGEVSEQLTLDTVATADQQSSNLWATLTFITDELRSQAKSDREKLQETTIELGALRAEMEAMSSQVAEEPDLDDDMFTQIKELHQKELEKQKEEYIFMKNLRLEEAARYKEEAYNLAEKHHEEVSQLKLQLAGHASAVSEEHHRELEQALKTNADLKAKHAEELLKLAKASDEETNLLAANDTIKQFESQLRQQRLNYATLERKHAEATGKIKTKFEEESSKRHEAAMQAATELADSYKAKVDLLTAHLEVHKKRESELESEKTQMLQKIGALTHELNTEVTQTANWQSEIERLAKLEVDHNRLQRELEIHKSPNREAEVDEHNRALRMAADAVARCELAEKELKTSIEMYTARIAGLETELLLTQTKLDQQTQTAVLQACRADRLEQELGTVAGSVSRADIVTEPTASEKMTVPVTSASIMPAEKDALEALQQQIEATKLRQLAAESNSDTIQRLQERVSRDTEILGQLKTRIAPRIAPALECPVSPQQQFEPTSLVKSHADNIAELSNMRSQLDSMNRTDDTESYNSFDTDKLIQLTSQLNEKFLPRKRVTDLRGQRAAAAHNHLTTLQANNDAAKLEALNEQLSRIREGGAEPWARSVTGR